MSRYLGALSLIVVGALLWLVMAWHAPTDDLSPLPPDATPAPAPRAPTPAAAPPVAPVREPVPVPVPASPAIPAPAPPTPEPPAADPQKPPEMIQGDQGPIEAYRELYNSEPRDSAANEVEAKLKAAFDASSEGVPDFIRSILCRQTLCKIEMMWSMDRVRPYIASLTRAKDTITTPVALSPQTPKDERGLRLVEVYVKRKPKDQPLPAHEH